MKKNKNKSNYYKMHFQNKLRNLNLSLNTIKAMTKILISKKQFKKIIKTYYQILKQ